MNLIQGDCLEVMATMPANSIDAVICDPPYGTTVCKWDAVIHLKSMWANIWRLRKPRGAVALMASQPFTSTLIASQIDRFKYEWIWQKAVGSNFGAVKYQPMKEHESVCVFSDGAHNYFPQKQLRAPGGKSRLKYSHSGSKTGETTGEQEFPGFTPETYDHDWRGPSSVQFFNNREKGRGAHPTQKPVALMEYLIRTYTKEGDTVLDFAMGSGTTGVAAQNLGRRFIGIELDEKYFQIAQDRLLQREPCIT